MIFYTATWGTRVMDSSRDIDEESLQRWKTTFAKDGISYKTDDEYREAIRNFVGFIDILVEINNSLDKQTKANDSDDQGRPYLLKDGRKIIL